MYTVWWHFWREHRKGELSLPVLSHETIHLIQFFYIDPPRLKVPTLSFARLNMFFKSWKRYRRVYIELIYENQAWKAAIQKKGKSGNASSAWKSAKLDFLTSVSPAVEWRQFIYSHTGVCNLNKNAVTAVFCNCPEFDSSVLRYSGIWEAVDEAVLN